MSSEKLNLSSEFEKICIDPLRKDPSDSPSTSSKIPSSPSSSDAIASHITHQNFKVRRKPLIKPSRLKFIYKTQSEEINTTAKEKAEPVGEDYTTEAFQLLRNLRISPSEMAESLTASTSQQASTSNSAGEEKDDRKFKSSCSAQYSNKLQQQLSSSSEFDSTIDVMSDYFSYHLNLHKDKNFSNVMYLWLSLRFGLDVNFLCF